jgi:phosphate uptake regulator
MKRKLILQGKTGLTIYLPKKWVDKRGLKPGEEIDISEIDNDLLISPTPSKDKSRSINLQLEKGRDSKQRLLLMNAYRAGFDKIRIRYEGKQEDITRIVNHTMLGFEIFKIKDNEYSIESIAEPDFEDFERITEKLFFILLELYANIDKNIDDHVHNIQKYDNFLKRLLTKNMFKAKNPFAYWQFLSNLTQVARICFHLNRRLKKPLNKEEKQLLSIATDMTKHLQKAYLTKDLNELIIVHEIEENIEKQEHKYLKNPLIGHYLLSLCRNVYLTTSSLSGIIQKQ